jgi:hypothetical protein
MTLDEFKKHVTQQRNAQSQNAINAFALIANATINNNNNNATTIEGAK